MVFGAMHPNVTHSQPSTLQEPWGAAASNSTFETPIPLNYRKIADAIPAAETEAGSSADAQVSAFKREASVPASGAEHSVMGVVGELEGKHARVTLFYGGRENAFLLDANDLAAAGASYAGALFEIVIGPDYRYKIVHSVEAEAAARRQAPPPDLAFLEDLE